MRSTETVPKVMLIVCSRSLLRLRELISLLLISSSLRRTLLDAYSLWLTIDLREMPDAGLQLIYALSVLMYVQVEHVNLEFARDIVDKHFESIKKRFYELLIFLKVLNLNGCQKISDQGIDLVTSICPFLKVTDSCIKHLVRYCRKIVDLNLSGCQNISDIGLELIDANYNRGLQQILKRCSNLQSLNLYALSSLTDKSYTKISLLDTLKSLDLCGAQVKPQFSIYRCVRVTGSGVIAIAQGCTSLEFLSLFGIVGVTDKYLEVLSEACWGTMATPLM